jgi:putative ABC transport system permease protein
VPFVYYPLAQMHTSRVALVARTDGDALALADTVRRTVIELDRDTAVYRVGSLEGHLAETIAGDRLTATLLAWCGGLALVLALVGIYGVVSYAVGRRTREIGVRVALGAGPLQIVGLVLGEGLRVLTLGMVVGIAAALAAARLLGSILFGISPSDPPTFAVVAGALGLVALIAAALPARRALTVNPVSVLRQD